MLQNLWQFLVGVAICVAGLIILYLDFASSAAHPTVADTSSYFFELGLGLALGGGIWAVIQVRQVLGLAKPEESGEKPPRARTGPQTGSPGPQPRNSTRPSSRS
jgi:hypothetical protein